MKKRIIQIIEELGPKHFSRRVKNNLPIWKWVLSKTSFLEDDVSMSERIYVAISEEKPMCDLGKRKKFKSIYEGYGFCGKTGICECARQSVSEKVSATKQAYTPEEHAAINEKREKTTMKLYGVTNNGQTENARKQHKEFYEDPEKVQQALDNLQKTLLERYGADNGRRIPGANDKAEQTYYDRTGFNNPAYNPEVQTSKIQTNLEKYGYEHHSQRPEERKRMSDRMRKTDDQDGFTLYKAQVDRWTRDVKKIYEAQGYKFGTKNDDYQLDHIIPKIQGFTESIPPWILGCKFNIALTTGLENKRKGGTPQSDDLVDMIVEKYFKEIQII